MKYPKETRDRILKLVAEGETVASACRILGNKPTPSTVRGWVTDDAVFAEQMLKARKTGFEAIADRAFAELTEEPKQRPDGKGYDSAWVQWQRNKFWGTMLLLSRWDPARYGDSSKVLMAGDASGAPIRISEEEAASRVERLIMAARARKAMRGEPTPEGIGPPERNGS